MESGQRARRARENGACWFAGFIKHILRDGFNDRKKGHAESLLVERLVKGGLFLARQLQVQFVDLRRDLL